MEQVLAVDGQRIGLDGLWQPATAHSASLHPQPRLPQAQLQSIHILTTVL